MPNPLPRRGLLRSGAAGVVAAVVGAPLLDGSPAEAADSSYLPLSPRGSWSAVVTFPNEPGKSERNLYAFSADGTLVQTGNSERAGVGWWRPTSTGFRFGFRHLVYDANRVFQLEVRVTQEATFTSSGAFTSTGMGTAVAADGSVMFTVATAVQAVRYGPEE